MFQALTGMRDLLPPETDRWRALVAAFAAQAAGAGYGEVIPPLLEDLGVFLRMGESTDVVTKEMYDFVDKDGTRIALRPEFTAAVMRVFVQRRPAVLPWKVWSWGAAFRHEKPQAGRFRQFMQLNLECVGSNDPDIDVEVISIGSDFLRSVGLQHVALKLNSLGDADTRPRYLTALRSYLDANAADLSEQARKTLEINPLRVLDSKRDGDQAVVAGAPSIQDYLGDAAGSHFDRVQAGLRDLRIDFVVEPRLVRGLDYYTHTLFEFASTALENAQNAVGGGGHYNDLVEQLGGPSTPGIGFAMGIDRILLACDKEGVFAAPNTSVSVYVIDTVGGNEAVRLTAELRRAGISSDRSFDSRPMRSQFKNADRSGASVAIVVGSDELESGSVVLRDLRTGVQVNVGRSDAITTIRTVLDNPMQRPDNDGAQQ